MSISTLDTVFTEQDLFELESQDFLRWATGENFQQDFPAAVKKANPRYTWHKANRVLANVLERVANDELKRVMIFMHPRSGKSEEVSRLFSAYYLYRHPERWVGLNSYGAELAYTLSRNARENYRTMGGGILGSAAAVKHWETTKGGGMWAAGVGGPILGKGFHLGIIDDPIKNAEEAESELIRRKHQDWYLSTFSTREEPEGAIVIIQQRWHEDDLSGWLLSRELEDEPEGWHIVHFEALKERTLPEYPPSCTLEPDWREPGEALIPERYPAEKLRKFEARLGPYFFGALYQQNPVPREGNMFKREWFDIIPILPANCELVRYWDKAGTKDAGAQTAGLLYGKLEEQRNGRKFLHYYIIDMIVGQWGAAEREAIIRQTAEMDRYEYGRVVTWVEQEPGSGGKESAEATITNLDGFAVFADRPTGDKVLRAEPVASQASGGNISLIAGNWNGRFLDIITAFPYGKIKDPVDALSGAHSKLAIGGRPGSTKYT